MNDPFDFPPYGYDRTRKKGWLKPAKGPQHRQIQKLKAQNSDLAARLEALESRLADKEKNG